MAVSVVFFANFAISISRLSRSIIVCSASDSRRSPRRDVVSSPSSEFSPVDRRAAVDRRLLDLPNGASGDASIAYVEENVIDVSDEEFEALWTVGEEVSPTPNPMNPKHHLLRKQATFGTSYAFGGRDPRRSAETIPRLGPRRSRRCSTPRRPRSPEKVRGTRPPRFTSTGIPEARPASNLTPTTRTPRSRRAYIRVHALPLGVEHALRGRSRPAQVQIYAKDPAAKRNVGACSRRFPCSTRVCRRGGRVRGTASRKPRPRSTRNRGESTEPFAC